ncbi:DUF4097 domain-containing protein [Oceanobacillus kimchii]|uniref:DUF4097 family beta strand repeat-containing protein n=1 Tax=Oceanobacillus kimchii TaxID=746691 RepID=UPI0009849FA4|nr:DUF4097 family beta strand repeat-containing protein [Oceanobacillus kimchii]MCT1577450.1 DUF4097 domain-containing protein [Oceanobacillus kimchii]MCT2137056.1 DUF4097 domain-containing protein [Oceanobacillus kimchii]
MIGRNGAMELITKVIKCNDVKKIQMDISVSNITVEPYEGNDIELTYTQKIDKPLWDIHVQEGILSIHLQHKTTIIRRTEDYKLKIKLPREFILDGSINNGVGHIRFTELTIGEFSIQLGSGGIHCEKVEANDLSINVGAGHLQLQHIHATNLDAQTGTGSISTKDLKGNADLNSGVGNINIALEKDSNIKLDLSTGIGKVIKDGWSESSPSIGNTSILQGEEEYCIYAVTGVGNIKVHKESETVGNS